VTVMAMPGFFALNIALIAPPYRDTMNRPLAVAMTKPCAWRWQRLATAKGWLAAVVRRIVLKMVTWKLLPSVNCFCNGSNWRVPGFPPDTLCRRPAD